jgi:hypothetical protein
MSRYFEEMRSAIEQHRAELDGEVKVFDVVPPWVESSLSRTVSGAKVSPEGVATEIVAGLRKDGSRSASGASSSWA